MNTPATVGDVGYVDKTYSDLFLPDRLWLARSKRGARTDMRWMTYFFASEPGAALLHGLASGTSMSMQSIPKDRVLALEIKAPDADEQRAIGDALEDVERLTITLERLIAKKRAIRQGMMQVLLTGHVRLPGFTAPWTEGVFEQLARPSNERVMPQTVADVTPLVDLDQIEGRTGRLLGVSQASDAVSLKAVFRPGDVLFGKLRAYLRKFWYSDLDGLCTTEIWVLHAQPGVHDRFVRYVVETDRFIEAASGAYGTHMPRSDWRTLKSLPVMVPPRDEQEAIASVLADTDSELDTLFAQLAKGRAIKQGMMQELLTGRTRLLVSDEVAA